MTAYRREIFRMTSAFEAIDERVEEEMTLIGEALRREEYHHHPETKRCL